MHSTIPKATKLLAVAIAASLSLTTILCMPREQAHAAMLDPTYQFNLIANGKQKSSAVIKNLFEKKFKVTVNGQKSSRVMLQSCGVIFRVHLSSNGKIASGKATFHETGTQKAAYWDGFGATGKGYRLWGQVELSNGNTGTKVGGTWMP